MSKTVPIKTAGILPGDGTAGTLVGRVWLPSAGGPAVVAVRDGGKLYDVTRHFPTVSALTEVAAPARALNDAEGSLIGMLEDVAANADPAQRDPTQPWLLAPIDLHVLKAAGVTFVASMLERVIEERARGNPAAATAIRDEIGRIIGTDLSRLKPGSDEAAKLKKLLIEQNAWSQYLEVGIGPDAEVFTKAPVLSAVGTGMDIGLHPKSVWNNPEPEVVLIVSSQGAIVGATLGNDVNLRDFEGRSALLLSKAKDNNASCAIGPLVRLFDNSFKLDDVRSMHLSMTVTGDDDFVLEGHSSIGEISRDPADLVAQTVGATHQYPDGFVLFLGTMFAPIKDRDVPGEGFTHKMNDIVSIAAPELGRLINRVRTSDACEPWTFGLTALMKNLAGRGVL